MARSISQANRSLHLVLDSFNFPLQRRGYAAGSDVSVRGLDRFVNRSGMVGKIEEKIGSEASSAWAPDPVTGYYRPINHKNEIDPVELRKMLLKHKVGSSS